MFLNLNVKLNQGELCKVICARQNFYGQIVRFKQIEYFMQLPFYVFETCQGERVILSNEFEFEALPFKESLRFLIQLSLATHDEEWFHELTYKLQYESQ